MAYFPNGSSGDCYMAKWCIRCTNWKDLDDGRGFGCPVWDAHLATKYKRFSPASQILDALIPMDKKCNPLQCSMFNQIDGEIEGQGHLEFPGKTQK